MGLRPGAVHRPKPLDFVHTAAKRCSRDVWHLIVGPWWPAANPGYKCCPETLNTLQPSWAVDLFRVGYCLRVVVVLKDSVSNILFVFLPLRMYILQVVVGSSFGAGAET